MQVDQLDNRYLNRLLCLCIYGDDFGYTLLFSHGGDVNVKLLYVNVRVSYHSFYYYYYNQFVKQLKCYLLNKMSPYSKKNMTSFFIGSCFFTQ